MRNFHRCGRNWLHLVALVLLLCGATGANAAYVRWTATAQAPDDVPDHFQDVVAPGGPIFLTLWVDLDAPATVSALNPNDVDYPVAQVQGRVGSYFFTGAQFQGLSVFDGALGDYMQATVVLTSPPNASGFRLGQFAFFLQGEPNMLSGTGIPTAVPTFSSAGFDVEACPGGVSFCTVPWVLTNFSTGGTLTAEIVAAIEPAPIPLPGNLLPSVLFACLLLRRARRRL